MGNLTEAIATAVQLEEALDIKELQRLYVEADLHYETMIKPFLDSYRNFEEALVSALGIGILFQDESGTVYKTDECDGRYVYNKSVQIKRTRREGETKGTLSMTEAREAGFVVEGK